MKTLPFKRKARLPDFDYRGRHRYFLTICTDGKRPLFADAERVKAATAFLADESRRHGFTVWGYCFMPDHLHLLLEGVQKDADLKVFVRAFKQKTGYAYRKKEKLAGSLWQPGYYDHVLRGDEDLQEVLKYIFNNPVRKGLVEYFADYPHLGSLAVDLKTVMF